MLFAFWDGEEKGLLGSEYWAGSPTLPLDRIRLVINIDMIGRLVQNRAEVYGTRTAPGLRQLLAAQNPDESLSLVFTWETRRDSDHYSFYSRRIPYLMVFTGDALPDANRRRTGLAVEPMTCAPNAFRTGDGLVVLEPGASRSGEWGISVGRAPR